MVDTTYLQAFPFNVPGVKYVQHVLLSVAVTIFVGDNGSRKSTLLESLTSKLRLFGILGEIDIIDGDYVAVRLLIPALTIDWNQELHKVGFFFEPKISVFFLRQRYGMGKNWTRQDLSDLV